MICVGALALILHSTVVWGATLDGKWLGIETGQERVRCWLESRRADGTYEITFLHTVPGGMKRHHEEGFWLHSNGMYATITQKINGEQLKTKERQYREVYRVESLDDKHFAYVDIPTGTRFRASRVPDNFVLGDVCPARG